MVKQIDRYYLMIFEGEGYIQDRQICKKVVKFSFPLSYANEAKEFAEKCMQWLNGDINE